jgi:hypothetical protein
MLLEIKIEFSHDNRMIFNEICEILLKIIQSEIGRGPGPVQLIGVRFWPGPVRFWEYGSKKKDRARSG